MEDGDLRFGLIDSETVIVAAHAEKRTGQTSDALAIESVRLTSMLSGYFDSYWHHPEALAFGDYARTEIAKLIDPSNPPTARGLAARLRISEEEALAAMSIPPHRLHPGIVVFVGRPGSGKSMAARLVQTELLRASYPHTVDIRSDYRILHKWSRSPEHCAAFDVTEFDGFRVRDFAVLDRVLDQLRGEISSRPSHLHLVEFARTDYAASLKTLGLPDDGTTIVVHVDAPLDVCTRRNAERRTTRLSPDSAYVPEDIMRDYYKQDNAGDLRELLGDKLVHVANSSDEPAALAVQVREAVVAKLVRRGVA